MDNLPNSLDTQSASGVELDEFLSSVMVFVKDRDIELVRRIDGEFVIITVEAGDHDGMTITELICHAQQSLR